MPGSEPKVFDAARFDATLGNLGDTPAPRLAHFRTALREGRRTLRESWEHGTSADVLLTRHTALVDALLTRAWTLHQPLIPAKVDIALVAVGGYGRGELYPHSDVDLLLLLKRDDHKKIQPFAETFLRFLWDLGLEVGHSLRSIKDCIAESKKDITVATNLMEARLLVGDRDLFAAMQERTGPARLWPSRKFFAAKLAEQIERHHHFGDTAYNLEPNIKEGPGGLRDIQVIAWVTQRHYGTAQLHDLVALGFLSEKEFRALERGRRLLAQLRCGLHFISGQREDRLLFDQQRTLATRMGFRNKRGVLAVELFMKRYYRTIKELALLNEILLQHFDEAILQGGKAKVRAINRRFQSRGGYLEVTRHNVFDRSPFAILELFLLLQQHPELRGVRASTIRLLRENLGRINTKFRNDLACRSLFMEILRQPHGITHELRRMNAYGVLGAYLPVFGRVVGQMQHDLFHVYTVDQHTLFVLRNVRRFTVPQFRHEFPFASERIQHVVKPERLYLAALFHDIAKGRGGDHSELGEHEAIHFCRQHKLSDYDTRFVAWLVRHHLLMSNTAQREDIDDPDTVLRFARQVGDIERLDHLYLLTVADMRGTSPKVWNVWKDRLLSQLYAATLRTLRRGLAEPMDVEARITGLKQEVAQRPELRGVGPDRLDSYWSRMDNEYFLRHDAAAVAWHASVILATAGSELPLVATRFHPDAGGTEFLVYSPDRSDLFAVLTGGFDRLNLTIMDARIHTTRLGFALDTFVVLDHDMQPITDVRTLNQLARSMREQLHSPQPGRDFSRGLLPRTLKHFPIATRVNFSSSVGMQQTVLEVTAQDRPGLLHQVALALQHCAAHLVTAKVATYGERAEDIFFVANREGRPLDSKQQQCLQAEIEQRLGSKESKTGAVSI